jgi:hypothetical protein
VAREHELDIALGSVPHDYLEAAEAFLQDDEQARRELWPTILLTLVTILMLEQALAWWFGTPGRVARPRWGMRLRPGTARAPARDSFVGGVE